VQRPDSRGSVTKVIAAAGLLALAVACSGRAKPTAFSIGVIPKGTTHEFWKAIHAGAVKAERELNAAGTPVTITWKGPLREDDREQQVQVVEGFVSQNISGIVIAPLDEAALVRPVEEAKRAGIPAIVIDSALDSKEIISFVATDNTKGGELAADRMAELLSGKGKVLLLRYQEGSASTTARETGFLAELKAKAPGIEVISSDQYAGPTRDTAKRASENLLNRYANELQGIFCVNARDAAGAAGHRQGRQGGLRRLRRQPDVH
jgi:ribose transport system substrate-binding protein